MRARDLTAALIGRWHGRYGAARCPCHEDRKPSLSITDGPDGEPVINCFAGCDWRDVKDTLRQRGLLSERAGGEQRSAPKPRLRAVQDDDEIKNKIAFARKIWRASQPIKDTDAVQYLRDRGITIPLPPTLRSHPGLKHAPTGLAFPALIAAIQGPDGIITGIQRIYLLPGGAGKARVSTPKMALGRISGGAVRLSAMTGRLALCEGIEDGLSILQERPDLTVWATLGTSAMPGVKVPESVLEITLCPDADEAGEKAAQEASNALARDGRIVKIARPPAGMDWNDLLNAPENVAFLDQHRSSRHVG